MCLTLNSIEQLHEELSEVSLNICIKSGLFKFFCIPLIRGGGGCGRSSTARPSTASFRLNVMDNLMKLPDCVNCEEDIYEYLDLSVTYAPEIANISKYFYRGGFRCRSHRTCIHSETATAFGCSTEPIKLEDFVVLYFADYICPKIIGKFHGECCGNNILRISGTIDSKQHL